MKTIQFAVLVIHSMQGAINGDTTAEDRTDNNTIRGDTLDYSVIYDIFSRNNSRER